MRIAILTGEETRHRYMARALVAQLEVAFVAYEQAGYSPAAIPVDDLTPEETRIVANHFDERARQESIFFGADSARLVDGEDCVVRRFSAGTLNENSTVEMLESAGVDTVVVYGTNLIKEPLLGRWSRRFVNMHLGLSPYYRGTATNFYPLLNEEPEYVGVTIHLIDAGIDSGAILGHARPEIVSDDMPHTIGCKAILAGIRKLVEVLKDLDNDAMEAVPQWKVANPRLYLRRDYHPMQVVELYRKLDQGLIPRYVKRAAQAAGLVRLVE